MTRRRKTSRPSAPGAPPAPTGPSAPFAAVVLGGLSLLSVICFFPLLSSFFAQDDFTLILKAWRDGWGAAAEYFLPQPGMFRPLTKAVYFGAMYNVFGLNPVPFHVVSMAVHLTNTVLVFVLFRRLSLSRTPALIASTLFALNVAFFHVIAWISCIQQLMGLMFMLAALVWGLDCWKGRASGERWWSVGAYIVALLSAEQTFAVPLILVARAWLFPGRPRGRPVFWRAPVVYLPHLVVLAVYAVFMAVWKSPPASGPYTFSFGANVAVNLLTYIGWSLQFAAAIPYAMQSDAVQWSMSHLLMLALLAYLVVASRWREAVFGVVAFVLAILPTLFLSGHTFYLHTYIPSFGVLYLIAIAVENGLQHRAVQKRGVRQAVVVAAVALMGVASFVMVRKNVAYRLLDHEDMPRSFVLRRASIARNVRDGMAAEAPFDPSVTRVYMVYAREGGRDEAKWNNDNVVAATGWGSLPPLVYGNPALETIFKVTGDAVEPEVLPFSDIYFYDDFGHSFLVEPVKND